MSEPTKPPYRRSGLYVSSLTPDEQAAMAAVRADLLSDCGGSEHVSAARRILIDLAAGAAVRCMRVNAYIAGTSRPWRMRWHEARRAALETVASANGTAARRRRAGPGGDTIAQAGGLPPAKHPSRS